jgi:NDP-sugar pyrophosphorylase family protein
MIQKSINKKTTIVYMCAGLSSRFNGKIKQFATVGPKGETLIEVSMLQAKKAGFDEIIFIVGEKTEVPFKEKFDLLWNKIPVRYAMQEFDPTKRDKPWGTCDALVSAKGVITSPFVVCNGDDIYGEKAFKAAHDFLLKNETDCVAIGYELGKVIPEKGKTNRGIFSIDKNSFVTGLIETIGIEKSELSKMNLKEKDLCSMNMFGLREETLDLLEKKLNDFKKEHENDRKIECYLPTELSNLIKSKKVKMKLLPTKEKWVGITNPEDEEIVRKKLSTKEKK